MVLTSTIKTEQGGAAAYSDEFECDNFFNFSLPAHQPHGASRGLQPGARETTGASALRLIDSGAGRKVYPGFLQLTGFMTMNLDRHLNAHKELFWHMVEGDGDSAEKQDQDQYVRRDKFQMGERAVACRAHPSQD